MKIPQIPPLAGMTPLGVKPYELEQVVNEIKRQDSLFELPFNLAGEPLDNSVGAEGQARAQAQAQAEANKAQLPLIEDESDPDYDYDTNPFGGPRYNARHEGRNDNGDGESYAERNL